MKNEVWCVPLSENMALIYAPFHGISTLVNRPLAETVFRCLDDEREPIPEEAEWIAQLRRPGEWPQRHAGKPAPLFLGLVPTRGCMMECAYCDFAALRSHPVMSFDHIRETLDAYADLLRETGIAEWNMHFFGGEPFAAFKEVVFAVNYARRKARELDVSVHFEVTTNGYYPEEKCRWIAENFDTVVLSLDGFPEVQNRHRPARNGVGSFETVCRNADIFSRGSCELIIRSCISAENADAMPEWAAFIAERWEPEAVCLEPMIESELARRNGLLPPDPLTYAWNWGAAYRILNRFRIPLVCSSGDIRECKNSLCPMGQDALIVDPDGRIGGCWQLPEYQQAGGLDLHFGAVSDKRLRIDIEALERQREMCEENRERCRGCFCYAHCAGGCVLNKERSAAFCQITKLLTLWQLAEQLDGPDLADHILRSGPIRDYLEKTDHFLDCGPASWGLPAHDISVSSEAAVSDSPVTHTDHVCPPLPRDALRGWIRDGLRMLIADTLENTVKILGGDEALRFQLEHSGMKEAEITAVWDALRQEAY